MKKDRILAFVCGAAAVVLLGVMAAHVSFVYGSMVWGAQNAGYSAPASVAFLWMIPYGAGIGLLTGLFVHFRRKVRRSAAPGA